MLKLFNVLLIVLATCFSNLSFSSNDEVVMLASGCVALSKMYESTNEKAWLAEEMASNSDSFGAGYCMGIMQVFEGTRSCRKYNWFELAEYIAAQEPFLDRYRNVDQLITAACGG
mgnify:CR=1 FL=1